MRDFNHHDDATADPGAPDAMEADGSPIYPIDHIARSIVGGVGAGIRVARAGIDATRDAARKEIADMRFDDDGGPPTD